VLTHIHPCPLWFASKGTPLFTGPTCPGTPGAAKCPEPLCTITVLPLSSSSLGPRQQALPRLRRSYGLMRQSSTLPLPMVSPGSTGLCRLLSAPAGRRTFPTLLCVSFPACLAPYPGSSCGASTRYFPHDIGLPLVRNGSALRKARTAISVRRPFRGCSHFFMFRPTGLLATQLAPTATADTVRQP
jgi:hypothetical protein